MSTFSMIVDLLSYILFTVGLWTLLKKYKKKSFWAFVPVYRLYLVTKLTEDEDLSFKWFLFETIGQVISVFAEISSLLGFSATFVDRLNIINLPILVCSIVYRCKGYSALARKLQVEKVKSWTLLCVIFPALAIFLWGISKKYQPIQEEETDISSTEESSQVEILEEGLTINLKERTVKKHFGTKKTLLRDIHLNIRPGRMVLLLGGSGAGKTTFLNAVTGYEKANAEVFLNNHNVYEEFNTVKHDIGFVPQQDLIRYNDTVKATVADFAKLRLPTNVKKEELGQKVDEALGIFGLQPVQDNMVAKQSGGQKKRTSISMEFVTSPSLFILDEPDSGLDGVLALDLMRRLHDIARTGKIVIVITHSPDRVLEFFDDVIILAKDKAKTGRLVFYGPVDEAKQFFGKEKMEDVIKMINRKEEGGEGLADDLIQRFEKEREAK